jgi:hypothetical protein
MGLPIEQSYFGALPTTVEINGQEFWVNVHLAEVDGRFVCVGIDLRSFWEADPEQLAKTGQPSAPTGNVMIDTAIRGLQTPPEAREPKRVVLPMNDQFVEITSPVVRGLRTSEVIEAAQAPLRDVLGRLAEGLASRPDFEAMPAHVGRLFGPPPAARRGPRPQLDDATLRDVVAGTYHLTAKRPVQAVRAALEESGALRPPVTIDQARKAVATARARGFIAPAKRSAKQTGSQS